MNKPSRVPFYSIIVGLILLGLGTAWLRHTTMEIPFLAGEQRPVWMIEARVDFYASGDAVVANLALPDNPPGFRMFTEQAASPGYGWSVIESSEGRHGEWTKRSASGLQTLYYKAQFVGGLDYEPTMEPEPPQAKPVIWDGPQATAAGQLLAVALSTSSTPQSMTRELI